MRLLAPLTAIVLILGSLTACTAPSPLADELDELLLASPGVADASATFIDNGDLDDLESVVTMSEDSTPAELAHVIAAVTTWFDAQAGRTHLSVMIDAPLAHVQVADTEFNLQTGEAETMVADIETIVEMLSGSSFAVSERGLFVSAELPAPATIQEGYETASAMQTELAQLSSSPSSAILWTPENTQHASSLYVADELPGELASAVERIWSMTAYQDGSISALEISAGQSLGIHVLALKAPADEDGVAVAAVLSEFEAIGGEFDEGVAVRVWFGVLEQGGPAYSTEE